MTTAMACCEPERQRGRERHRQLISSQLVGHKLLPGSTGWAQVNGFRGEIDSFEKMEERIRCDLDYLRNWLFLLGLYITFKTARRVFKDSAAYLLGRTGFIVRLSPCEVR